MYFLGAIAAIVLAFVSGGTMREAAAEEEQVPAAEAANWVEIEIAP